MKSIFLNAVFGLFCFTAMSQNKLTLQQAIQMGIANNIDVRQSDLSCKKPI